MHVSVEKKKKKKKQVALAEPWWAVVWDYLFAFLKKIVSSDVLRVFQMSLIKPNKSSNNGQPATYLVEVAGASEPIKKRSKAKKGHSRITFDKYWLTNGYYK